MQKALTYPQMITDDLLCCTKKTAAARYLSPSSSRSLAKSTSLQNKHCHKSRGWIQAFHKRNPFNSFSYWFVFHCFPLFSIVFPCVLQGHLIIGLWPWRWSAATQLNTWGLGTSMPDRSHRSAADATCFILFWLCRVLRKEVFDLIDAPWTQSFWRIFPSISGI